jgi:hypothetical protein
VRLAIAVWMGAHNREFGELSNDVHIMMHGQIYAMHLHKERA